MNKETKCEKENEIFKINQRQSEQKRNGIKTRDDVRNQMERHLILASEAMREKEREII